MTLASPALHDALGPDIRIERALPGGGMSQVYLARDLSLARDVVVKVLPHDLVSDVSTARFRREIALMVRLQHPHILPILRAGTAGDSLFHISPYIAGETLRDWLARDKALPLDATVRILKELAGALAFAHSHGVIHRDVKPANIFLSQEHAILADFGIARAVVPDEEQLTLTNTAPGTPAYLAPERPSDETADLYALAVVGHEMLTGSRPDGLVTVTKILAARTAAIGTLPDRRTRAVAAAIARALSPHPNDRFRTAAAFLSAVEHPQRHLVGRMVRHIAPVAATAVLIIASGFLIYSTRAADRIPLVEDRYLVMPFSALGPGEREQGLTMASDLADALSQWRGVQVAQLDSANPDDARDGSGGSIARALDRARDRGASRLLAGEVASDGDELSIRVTLWDVHGAKPLRSISASLPESASERGDAMARLANAILRETAEPPPALVTPILSAMRAYDRARALEKSWHLDSAAAAYAEAIRLDSRLALAHLGLSRVLTWGDDRTRNAERTSAAERTAMHIAQLQPSDSALALALLAQARSDYDAACREFDRLLARDPNGIAPLVGAGDCRARDRGVTRDPSSSSGWRFRGGYAEAASFYERALVVADAHPDFLYRRLRTVLPIEGNRVRQGQEVGGARRFQALAELSEGGVVYLPHDVSQRLSPVPATLEPALALNRRRLKPALVAWASANDTNPEPHRHLSELLELEGAISESGENDLTALEVIRTARRIATSSWDQPPLAQIEIRQLVKNGDYSAARRLADSVLADSQLMTHPDSTIYVAGTLAALAALTGRAELVTRLSRLASKTAGQQVVPAGAPPLSNPGMVARQAAELVALASLGVCNDDVRRRAAELPRLVRASVGEGAFADSLADMWTAPALSAAVSCVGANAVLGMRTTSNPYLAAQQSLARGEHGSVRAYLAGARATLRQHPRDVTIDKVMGDASLMMAIGDSAAARAHVELALMGLSSASLSTLERVPHCGALVQAFALAARLAASDGDREAAARWASAVTELWGGADAELQPVVHEMRSIAAS